MLNKEVLKAKLAAAKAKVGCAVAGASCALLPAASAFAGETGGTEPATDIALNFDATQLFTYTNIITTSMMPVVYISAGFGLGFTIIYSLKNAFGGRM